MVTHTLTCLPLKMRTLMFLTKLFICLHTGCLWCVEHNGRSDRYFDLGVKGQSFVCLFDFILYVPSTIFQLNGDGPSFKGQSKICLTNCNIYFLFHFIDGGCSLLAQ